MENEEVEIESVGVTLKPIMDFERKCKIAYTNSELFYEKMERSMVNWCAFLFGPFYFVYRRLTLEGLLLWLVTALLPLPYAMLILVWGVEGLAFYPLYRRKMQKEIAFVNEKFPTISDDEKLLFLGVRGKPSLKNVLIMFLIISVVAAIATALLSQTI